MNNSGIALRQCMDFYKVPSEDILVLYDDMDMPVGKLRLRQKVVLVVITESRVLFLILAHRNLIVFA